MTRNQALKPGKHNPKLNGMTEVLPLFDSHSHLSLDDFRRNQHTYGTSTPLPSGFTQNEIKLGNTLLLSLEGQGAKKTRSFFSSTLEAIAAVAQRISSLT